MAPGSAAYGGVNGQLSYVLTVDPVTDLGFAVASAGNAAPSVFHEYDLQALRRIRDFTGPQVSVGYGQGNVSNPAAGVAPLAAVDEARHRIIFVEQEPITPTQGSCSSQADQLGVLDETTLTWTELPLGCLPFGVVPGTGASLTASGDTPVVAALDYDNAHRALYVMLADNNDSGQSANGGTEGERVRHYLEQIDESSGAVVWRTLLPECDYGGAFDSTAPYGGGGAAMIGRHGDTLDLLCLATADQQYPLSGQRITPVLVRVPLSGDGRAPSGTQDGVVIGHPFTGAFDSADGSVVFGSTQSAYDYGSYVVDGTTGLARGFVPTGADTSFNGPDDPHQAGIDVSRDRIYMRTHNGMVVSDIGHQPVPAGILVPSAADPILYSNQLDLPISVDPLRHRLYMFDYDDKLFRVYEDDIPPIAEPAAPDPDAATRDVAEAPGVTGATYSGSGDAFGLRYLSEGGANRIVGNATASCPPSSTPLTSGQSASVDRLLLSLQECQANLVLSPGDRDWRFGDVPQVAASTIGVAAQASAVDVQDAATAQDLNRAGVYGTTVDPSPVPTDAGPTAIPTSVPGPAEVTSPAPAQSRYLTFPVDRPQDRPGCFDAGADPGTNGEESAVGAAEVACNDGAVSVAATAVAGGGAPTIADPMATPSPGVEGGGEFWSQVRAYRDAGRGFISSATAVAQNVQIPIPGAPTVLIREIVTTANAVAHGRPRTATASFTRKIMGFVSVAAPGTTGDYRCSDDPSDNEQPCDAQAVAAAITADIQAAGFTGYAVAPSPDAAYLRGTPGGYQAVVTKDAAWQANDATLDGDASDTVDGLQVVFIDDGQAGRTRQVLQLAAVHVEAHYGIYLLGDATEAIGGGGAPGADASPASGRGSVAITTTSGASIPAPASAQSRISPLMAVIRHFAAAVQEGWRLLVYDPQTAAALAGVLALLGLPVYLAVRRRSLVRRVA